MNEDFGARELNRHREEHIHSSWMTDERQEECRIALGGGLIRVRAVVHWIKVVFWLSDLFHFMKVIRSLRFRQRSSTGKRIQPGTSKSFTENLNTTCKAQNIYFTVFG